MAYVSTDRDTTASPETDSTPPSLLATSPQEGSSVHAPVWMP